MHDDIRKELEEAYRLADVAGRDFDQWQAKYIQVEEQQDGSRLVYKTHFPTQQLQQSARVTTMAPEVQSLWDAWAEARIARALQVHMKEVLVPSVGEAIGMIRKQLREEFAAEIALLRTDLTVQTGIARAETAQIKGSRCCLMARPFTTCLAAWQ